MVNNIERNVRGVFLIEMKDKAKDTTRVYECVCVYRCRYLGRMGITTD